MIGDTRYYFSWTKNSIAWNDIDLSYQVVNYQVENIEDDIRFKNYYRNYINHHIFPIIIYARLSVALVMKWRGEAVVHNHSFKHKRIEFKGSYSRKYQRPRKFRGQRLF